MSESQFLINQKKINGRLCQVDWRLIQALREVVAALRASGPNAVHTDNAERLILEADRIGFTVAIPDPPGCDPFNREAAPGKS
jgi:hypothetical protein